MEGGTAAQRGSKLAQGHSAGWLRAKTGLGSGLLLPGLALCPLRGRVLPRRGHPRAARGEQH